MDHAKLEDTDIKVYNLRKLDDVGKMLDTIVFMCKLLRDRADKRDPTAKDILERVQVYLQERESES